VERVKALVESLPGENRLDVVEGVEHFFIGKLDRVDWAIGDWMTQRHPGLGR
jgi:alpha/beta superfamily hydrolase